MEPLSSTRDGQAKRPAPLTAGQVIGKRYQIQAAISKGPYGELYKALDKDVDKLVAIRFLRPDLVAGAGALERLQTEFGRLAKLEHKNLVKTLGVVSHEGVVGIVSQYVEGRTLRAMIAAKEGEVPLSLKAAYNVFAHLCNALHYLRDATFHGAVTPSNVVVNKAGRVKLTELGLARALPAALPLVEAVDKPCIPPEMQRNPEQATARADLYCLGAILFELLTGKMYMPGMLPRRLNPSLPPDVDPLISLLLAPKPEDRYADPLAAKAALAKVLDKASTSMQNMSAAAVNQAAARPSGGHPVTASGSQRIVVDENEYRWLVSKGKLDFGPFTLLQIKEQIAKDEIVPGNILIDNENGKRAEVEAHPLLRDLVMSAAQRRDDARRENVEATVVKQDVKRGVALYGFVGIGAVVLTLAVILIFKFTHAGQTAKVETNATHLEGSDLAGLKVSTAKHVDDRAAQRQHKATHPTGTPGSRPAHPGGADGFDDSQSFDMVGAEVGDERLDDSQINAVIGSHAGPLGRCLSAEVGRGGTHQADIDFIVLGSGHVSAVRVNGQSGTGLASCIRGAMQSMPFPSFNGPRTKASFSMSL